MSYRSFKKAIGETSLERKCRLLFGTCLLPLIAGSFWWYGTITKEIINEQNVLFGEALANAALIELHMTKQEKEPSVQRVDEDLATTLRSHSYRWEVLMPPNEKKKGTPEDQQEWAWLDLWREMGTKLTTDEQIDALKQDNPQWRERISPKVPPGAVVEEAESHGPDRSDLVYQYYEPVFAKKACIGCHSVPGMPVYWPDLRVGDLLGIVRVETDAAALQKKLSRNTAWLITMAIVTVFLAMIALYGIVRYVIVKPLRHLRDVSNAVRQGDTEQRAVIHTGDEFEELGAAYNRMLRQLLRQQDELREVNIELDEKIDEMAQANMRLFEMNQIKSDFLATVSHELRTPLNSIIGFSDLLSNVDKLDDKQRRFAGNIQRSGRQLLEMINDILDLAKIESGKMEVRPADFSIGSVVAAQCDMARPLSEKKNIDLECQVEPALPLITQDQSKIEQILNNLLSNAIKFTPEGGRITVSVRRDRRGDLRLTVADTGVGINESEQTLIFEKFRQGTTVMPGGNAMTREYSGTGLGLSIVRELCRLLGGDITLESDLGKGSRFTVLLPWEVSEVTKVHSDLTTDLRKFSNLRPETPAIATQASDI